VIPSGIEPATFRLVGQSVPTLTRYQPAATYVCNTKSCIQFWCSWCWAKMSLETCRAAKE